MAGVWTAPTHHGNGWARADRLLRVLPKGYFAAVLLLLQGALLYGDFLSGPWIPFSVFYLLSFYFAVKYVGGRFAYLSAFLVAAGRTFEKVMFIPGVVPWWQWQWQFLSTFAVYALFCFLIDYQLGARRRAEDALDEMLQLNAAIITQADSGILVFGDDHKCILANQAAADMLGIGVERLTGGGLDNVLAVPELLEAGRQTMRSGAPARIVVRLSGAAGHEAWAAATVGRVERGGTRYLLMELADITDFRAAEEARLRADHNAAQAIRRARDAEHRLVGISEETQQRIGRELHDDLGQLLTGMAFHSQVLAHKLREAGREECADADRITAMLGQCISKTRSIAHGLSPAELYEGELHGALEKFADHVAGTYGIECDYICDSVCPVEDREIATQMFRIAQEAVNNAVRHGRATWIGLTLSGRAEQPVLEVEDNGSGIPEGVAPGLGLRSMRYRAALVGATLQISARPEGGTRVRVAVSNEQHEGE